MTHLLWSMSSLSPCTRTNFLKAEKVFLYLVTVAIIRVAELHGSPLTLSWLHKARSPKILIFSLRCSHWNWGAHVLFIFWHVWSVFISCVSSNPYIIKLCQYLGSPSFLSRCTRGNGCGSEHAAAGRRPFGWINFDLKATSCLYLLHNRCERELKLGHKLAHVSQQGVQVSQHAPHSWKQQLKIKNDSNESLEMLAETCENGGSFSFYKINWTRKSKTTISGEFFPSNSIPSRFWPPDVIKPPILAHIMTVNYADNLQHVYLVFCQPILCKHVSLHYLRQD